MGRARGRGTGSEPERRAAPLPPEVRRALAPDVQRAWAKVAPLLPTEVYLGGGTAAALRLQHRRSQDLDFFYHENAVDLDGLARLLTDAGAVITERSPGTLKALIGKTKVEFLHADEARPQRRLAEPDEVAGLAVASAKDLMAMKLKVLAERGELRDYFDVKELDERGLVSLEHGIQYWMTRYGVDRASTALAQLIRSLGYLDDAEEDASLPMTKAELAEWWRARQARLLRNLRI
jgi:hypothetical protein